MKKKSSKEKYKIILEKKRKFLLDYSLLSDEELIKHIVQKKNEDIALKILMRRYQKKIIGIIFPYVKDEEVAKDIYQETLLRTLLAIDQEKYEEQGNFGAWVIKIARNLATDYLRKQKKQRLIPIGEQNLLEILTSSIERQQLVKKENTINNIPEEFIQYSYDQKKDHNETLIKLREAIKQLPEPQRKAIILRFYHNKKYKEIAEATGVNINTALARVRYGIIHLRKMLQKENNNGY